MASDMSVLASILVRDQVIPVERVQEAIQEQVMRGGNLDTVLLELGLLRENEMNAYCAAVFGLLPGTRDEVMQAPIGTIRVLPREFAVRHRVIPVARTEDAVVLAVDRPLPEATLREISFELGIDPVQRVTCSVRIEAGLSKHYDIEMTTRMRYLNERLIAVPAGTVPYVAPFEGVGKRSSLPPKKEVSGSFPRVDTSVPAPASLADTEPPEQSVQDVVSSVPAGTFRDSDPGSVPKKRSEPSGGFVDGSRYSLPPRPPEVLGRPSAHHRFSSGPVRHRNPSIPQETHTSAARWKAVPTPPRRAPSSVPSDPRRDNDGSALAHDVVSLRGRPPSAVPRPDAVDPSRRKWNAAPPPVPEGELPSIIVDVGDDVERIVRDMRDTGPDDERAILPVLGVGEAALPALAREFPGRLWFDRSQPHARAPSGRDISAIARAFVAFGRRSVPYLIPLLENEDPDVRYYATALASEFVHPDLVQPVGRRIFDADPGVRSNAYRALSVLYACEVEFMQLIERLRASARDDRDLAAQTASVDALGRLRDAGSFGFLVSLLDREETDLLRATHASLVRLSCQDFGITTKKWLAWYDKNGERHRVEWLIDSLTHSDERLRRRAIDELKHLTQEYFGYDPEQSKKEREAAQRQYRAWWQRVGFRLFTEPGSGDSGQARGQ
jgi:hypothetical protein